MINEDQELPRAVMKRKLILNAAKEIFLNQGFRYTSMDGVAKCANVSKKTVYHHFQNKEILFRTMLSEHWVKLFESTPDIFKEDKSIDDNLKRFASLFFKFLYHKDTIDFFRILISESNQFPGLVDDVLIGNKAPFTRALITFLKECSKQQKLTIDNPDRAASFFIGLLKEDHFWPMMLGFVKTDKPKNKKALINEAVAMFINFYSKEKAGQP